MAGRPATLVRRLRALCLVPPRLTLAVAESITCGRLQAAVGAVSGASDFFVGGMTAYTIDEKVRHLDVDRVEAERCEAVSALVAAQMAVGACRLFGSDLAAATTGYAEPRPGRGVDAPLAYFAIARRCGDHHEIVRECKVERPGLARVAMQRAVAAAVLETLVEAVRRLRQPPAD